jgi:hypothetical protein
MLFPTHLVAAYVIGKRLDLSLLWVVLGAAAPDLIDKPLATTGLVDLYQSIGHSALLFLGITVVVLVRREWVALWVGWTSHLLLDASHMIINGRPDDLQFLAWPLIKHTPAVHLPPIEFFFYYVGTPSFYVEIVLWLVFVYVLIPTNRVE